jgi:carboxylate-amine ligase
MTSPTELFTVGVEEEYQVIDPETRELCPRSHHILPLAQDAVQDGAVQLEFRQSQIEVATPVCVSLPEIRYQLTNLRRHLIEAAAAVDCQLAAAGTHPFSPWQAQLLTPKACYQDLADRYQGLMHELVTFGCHVHVGMRDRDRAIQVMNRVRPWLAPLLALSASSPFWLGQDTQYASYRTLLIRRLPMTGPPPCLASYADYQAVLHSLLATQIIDLPTQICWDVRPSERFPTLEFRIPDMPLTVDETVMLTGLVRGLVRTCYEQGQQSLAAPDVRPEVLEAAQWQAARWGLEADLVAVAPPALMPARQLIEMLLAFVRPALEAFGEWDEVAAIARQVLQQGTSATRQRQVFQQRGKLTDVVDYLVQETRRGCLPTAPMTPFNPDHAASRASPAATTASGGMSRHSR